MNIIQSFKDKRSFKLRSKGLSMLPTLLPDDIVYVKKKSDYKVDDIVMVYNNAESLIHRIIYIKDHNNIITKGDNSTQPDNVISTKQIGGVIYAFKRNNTVTYFNELYRKQSSVYIKEIKNILERLHRLKINYVILKGWPLHLQKNDRYPLRIYADCDILIDKVHIDTLLAIFFDRKYFKRKASFSKTIFSKQFSNFAVTFYVHKELNLLYNQYGILQKLFPSISFSELKTAFLKDKQKVIISKCSYFLLSPVNQLFYLCLDFAHYNFKELYRLRLIHDIIKSNIKEDHFYMQKVMKKISKFHLENFIFPTFIFLQEYYSNNISVSLLNKIKPSKPILVYINNQILNTSITTTEKPFISSVNRLKHLFYLFFLSFQKK